MTPTFFIEYACYGGGFATMPAGRDYGRMLTAWGVAGVM